MDRLFEALEPRMFLSADALVESFADLMVEGEVVRDSAEMAAIVEVADADAVYSVSSWGGENYWFQDSEGQVWAIWHGGAVHDVGGGEHRWFLTSITEQTGELEIFRTESMSGTFTPWRAFNIVGLASDGSVVTYWWSPESGAAAMGVKGTGWVLTNLSASVDWTPTGEAAPSFVGSTQVVMRGQTIVVAATDFETGITFELTHTPGVTGAAGEHWLSAYERHSLAEYLEGQLAETGALEEIQQVFDENRVRIRITPGADLVLEHLSSGGTVLDQVTFAHDVDMTFFDGELPSFGYGQDDPDDFVILAVTLITSVDAGDLEGLFDMFFDALG